MTYLIKEISDPSSGIRLNTLNLSENLTVNDEVLKLVSHLFKSSPSIQHFYFDRTNVTIYGLKKVLKAIQDRRNIRTISTKDNNMSLMQEDGKKVVELLENNFSLTVFSY